MKSNDRINERRIRRRPGANNLPGSRAKKPGWNHPVMKAAKMFARLYALSKAGSEDRLIHNRDWLVLGIRSIDMLAHVRRLIPYFDEVWKEQGRQNLSDAKKASALHNRVWYMYTEREKNNKPVERLSKEHPLRSKRLRPFLGIADDLFRENRQIPRETIDVEFSDERAIAWHLVNEMEQQPSLF